MLGICVGMQVLFDRGVEFGEEAQGAGQWPGTVEKLQADVLPHMGWNTVRRPPDSVLFAGMDPATRFYFVHSFAVRRWEQEAPEHFRPPRVTWAHHGEDFVAAVENGPLSATQFHPEKSGDAGRGPAGATGSAHSGRNSSADGVEEPRDAVRRVGERRGRVPRRRAARSDRCATC